MKRTFPILVVFAALGIGSLHVPASAAGEELSDAKCESLARVRDTSLFAADTTSARMLAASSDAQRDLRALLAETSKASKDVAVAGTSLVLLRLIIALSKTLEAFETTLDARSLSRYLKSGDELMTALEGHAVLTTAYVGKEFAQRVIEVPETAETIARSESLVERAMAYGSLVPVVGSTIQALSAWGDLLKANSEVLADQKNIGSQFASLERQLAAADARYKTLGVRQAVMRQVKDYIDAHCGQRKKSVAAPSSSASLLAPLLRPAPTPPAPKSTVDCGILDDGEASADLAMNDEAAYQELLRSCRARRGPSR